MTSAPTKTVTVHIGFVLDESGSMNGNQQAVTVGFNEFVGSLKQEQTEDQVRVFMAKFDLHGNEDRVREVFRDTPLAEVRPLVVPSAENNWLSPDYQPRGMTPLNDAVAMGITRLGEALAEGDRGLLVIFTDGQENASELSTEALRHLVQKTEADGRIEFIYIGANVDAFAESQKMGMSGKAGQSVNFRSTPVGTANAMKTAANRGVAYTSDAGTYAATAGSTPLNVAEDPEEFKRQQEAMQKAREEAEKARAERQQEAAEQAKAQAAQAKAQATRVLRGKPEEE